MKTELYEKALLIRKEMLGENHPYTVYSNFALADLHEKQGKYDEAKTLYQKVLPISSDVLGENHDLTRAIDDRLKHGENAGFH